ncbi:carbon-nitrogen hydrolase family protein [Thalassorhabdomicrobium marinisediminis]|uniref:carbon-nitrogen hydrolase family protein n=1 Tax=Thalassorhabdomicrobium marinisediminis TaxID=2170577 RepID=UPI0024911D33|nr:carbon-nitrogen hydrolase family protein [Thalassorhabdomicrobium marinisediminis]
MSQTLRLSIAQMTSTNRHEGNIAWMEEAAAQAAEDGAQMLALPEASGLVNKDRDDALRLVVDHDADPFIAACRAAAAKHGLWIQTGSTPVKGPDGVDGPRFLNHGDMIDPDGRIVAGYDKIHLFDIHLDGKPPTGESRRYGPGRRAVLADTPWGPAGLAICYDLRFPQLFRDYGQRGATLLFVPSAFTVPTGRAHWEVLLRARAIENGAFVIASAQVGKHDDGRVTYGHSMVVSPWGEVLVDMGSDGPGLRTVDLNLDEVAAARRQIPSLQNGRDYSFDD